MHDTSNGQEIATKIAAYLSDSKGLPDGARVGPETSLLKTGLVDSLAIGDLIVFLEATFEVKVEDEDMIPEHFETVAAIAAFVERKIGEMGG